MPLMSAMDTPATTSASWCRGKGTPYILVSPEEIADDYPEPTEFVKVGFSYSAADMSVRPYCFLPTMDLHAAKLVPKMVMVGWIGVILQHYDPGRMMLLIDCMSCPGV